MNVSKIIISILILFLIGNFIIPFQMIVNKGHAASPGSVVINEIAWMGTNDITDGANDEWIELYNNTSSLISLDGWVIAAEDGSPTITLSGSIPASGYFLIERDDDQTIPSIPADLIYTNQSNLVNTGEVLYLKDSTNNIIDQVNTMDNAPINPKASPWPAGDSSDRATMERLDSTSDGTLASSWTTSTSSYEGGLGTPNDINSAIDRKIKASPHQLTEDTLNNNVITLNINADSFKSNVSSNIQLNNAPPGTSIKHVELFDEKTVYITLNYDGTDFDNDYSDFCVTVLDNGLNGTGNITSNKIAVKAVNEVDGFSDYQTLGTSFPTLIEMAGYNIRDKNLYINAVLHTEKDVTGKTATFYYFIKVFDQFSNSIGNSGDIDAPLSITAIAGEEDAQLKNLELILTQDLPASYRIVIVVKSVEIL